MTISRKPVPNFERIDAEALAMFADARTAIFPPDGHPDSPCSATPSRRRLWRQGNIWLGRPSGIWRGYDGGRIHGSGYGFVSLTAWATRTPPRQAAIRLAEALGIDPFDAANDS
jgi:hypothetical protein